MSWRARNRFCCVNSSGEVRERPLDLASPRTDETVELVDIAENYSTFTPRDQALPQVETMLDQLVSWTKALEPVRAAGAPAS